MLTQQRAPGYSNSEGFRDPALRSGTLSTRKATSTPPAPECHVPASF